ncbi:uncharacterized protein LOC130732239 [Lotus japonicus]|uniref:uncharacterized protein LOC130732239 n=1 Tax=Lotus japonicus TaxID=34305 RepID=UPI00258D6F56|nr:uncharacterized protein LOC130732239 [Lotus japonicus]
MVGVFRRSISLPNKNLNRPTVKPAISHHIRSISLPCRSHPLISQIKEEINGLNAWASTSKSHPQTYTNISHGLTLLKDTHETFQHIFQLPQTQESLRCHPLWVENLLEDSLRFVDAYGTFQTLIMGLKEEHSSAQIAIRKRDESKLGMYMKSKKKFSKEMEKLVSSIRCGTQTQQQHQHLQMQVPAVSAAEALLSVADTAELGGVISDVMRVTVFVSVALFNGIAMSFAPRRFSWTQMVKLSRSSTRRMNVESEGLEELQLMEVEESFENLKKKGDEEVRLILKRMRDLEECVCGIESVSEKVFRALINSRVLLLNTLTLAQ